jgi:hypothetical protein
MALHVNNTGPLVVCVDATKWSTYTGGVLSSCGGDVNHCLQVCATNRWGGSMPRKGHDIKKKKREQKNQED